MYDPSVVRRISVSILLLLILSGTAPSTNAQETGVVAGHISDSATGEDLPGVNVSLAARAGTGTTTGGEGRFLLSGVPAGDQRLRVTHVGYENVTRTVTVAAGDTVRISVNLEPATAVLEGIEVSALSPDLRPEDQLEEIEVREANPRDSGELLRSLPGLDAVRRGPVGLDPVVRGLRETEVGVYLDGTRLFPGGPARMDSPLSHLDPSFVKSINVVKGPYALTWGAGNLSAIRVETQDVSSLRPDTWNSTLMGGYDTNMNALESAVSTRGREGPFAYWLHGAWRQGGDYTAGEGTTVPGDFLSREMRGKLGYKTGSHSNLIVSSGYQRQDDIDYPGRLLNADYFDTQNYSARWEMDRQYGVLRSVTALAYLNSVDHGMTNDGKPTAEADPARMPPFPLLVNVDAEVDVWGGRLASRWVPNDRWEVEAGMDLYSARKTALRHITNRETGMVPPPLRPQPDFMWPETRTTDAGLFTRIERSLDGGITLAGTARLDIVRATADTASAFFRENVSTDLSRAEENLSGAFTVNKSLSRFWQVTLGVGSAVRTADATERYSDRIPASKAQMSAEFVGTPDLQPERSTQIDLWLEGQYPNLALSMNTFGRRIDDYITLAPTDLAKRLPLSPETVYRYISGSATFWGTEVSMRYRPVDALTISLQPVYLWGRDEHLDEPALGIAPMSVDTGLRYEPPGSRFFAAATLHAVSGQDRVASTRGEVRTDGYLTADLKGGIQLIPGVSAQLGVTNLTDAAYINHLNAANPFTGRQLPEPGRVFFADLQVQF